MKTVARFLESGVNSIVFDRTKKRCSFCGKHHSEVAKLIAGDGVAICNECVLICSSVLMKECEIYRVSELHQMRDYLQAASKAEPDAPNGAAPTAPGDSATTERPPVTPRH